ncbi:MAG: sigma-70 family RNA polymerase sigma factor [Bacteroidales bacterium]|nr:sigma-70 family RNA polymerase sigma factor [Bacteroidales bacterium]
MAKTGSKPIDELVRLAIIGDGAAFTQLWDTHIDSLRNYLRGTFRRMDEFYVDDICSKSFEKAFRQIGAYDPSKSQFATWLKTIAHNTAIDLLDQENRKRRQYVSLDDGVGQQNVLETLPDEIDTPLESIIRDEDEARTRDYISGLPELYRDVAEKRLVDGLRYKEIAEELDMELNTVRTRIRRAKALIDRMKDEN